MIYGVEGIPLNSAYDLVGSIHTAYDVDGIVVFSGAGRTDYSTPTITYVRDISSTNTQGMETWGDILLQFMSDNKVKIANLSTGVVITSSVNINSGHGNAICFGRHKYATSDEFPIIVCGDWYNPVFHVNRVTRTSSTHLYDIVCPIEATGYHPNHAIDWDNLIMYTVGYYLDSTETETGNHCIVCKWDLSDLTDNGNGTFTPAILSIATRDFISVMQDLKYNDGYVWISAGGTGQTGHIYGMNPDTTAFDYTITMPITTEIEGLSWQMDNDGQYFAYIGFQGGKYYTVTFGEL